MRVWNNLMDDDGRSCFPRARHDQPIDHRRAISDLTSTINSRSMWCVRELGTPQPPCSSN